MTSKEGSSKVMVSGGSVVRYVSKGLRTLGQTPSKRAERRIQHVLFEFASRYVSVGPVETCLRNTSEENIQGLTMPQLVLLLGVAW